VSASRATTAGEAGVEVLVVTAQRFLLQINQRKESSGVKFFKKATLSDWEASINKIMGHIPPIQLHSLPTYGCFSMTFLLFSSLFLNFVNRHRIIQAG
jgi:hypothetical protein